MKSHLSSTLSSMIRDISLTLALAALLPSCANPSGSASSKPETDESAAVSAAGAKVCRMLNGSSATEIKAIACKGIDGMTSSNVSRYTEQYSNAKVSSSGILSYSCKGQGAYISNERIQTKNLVCSIQLKSYADNTYKFKEEVIQPVWRVSCMEPSQRKIGIATSSFDMSSIKTYGFSVIFQTKQQAEVFKMAFESLQVALR